MKKHEQLIKEYKENPIKAFNQIEFCNFETEGGPIELNTAYQAIKQLVLEDEMSIYAEKFIEKYGRKKQMLKAIEESAELIQAIGKVIENESAHTIFDLCGEVVDMEMMITQIKKIITEVYNQDEMLEKMYVEKNKQWEKHFE